MTDRQRIRRGRSVTYNPTPAEVAISGAGPYLAMITRVLSNGSVDLIVDTPTATPLGGAALADPLITQADASANGVGYVQADVVSIEDLAIANKVGINALVTLVNELRAVSVGTRKNAVLRGAQAGQFSLFQTGPQAV